MPQSVPTSSRARQLLPLLAGTLLALPLAACHKAAPQENGSISGTIQVQPDLASKVKADAALYVIAHPDGQQGPPAAVERISPVKFPVSYSLSSENVMLKGMPFAGKMDITVRLSNDGNAMPAPGDLEGASAKNPVMVGDDNVDVTLDQQDR